MAAEEEALAKRGVWLRRGADPATPDVTMTLDTDSLDVRRAKAPGIMADPQYALDLMSGREGPPPPRAQAG